MKAVPSGPDPNFPYLDEHHRITFPDPLKADSSIIAFGGNLSPGMLLSAYEQGIFPWFNPGEPVLWQSPDPRCIIFPEKLHVSHSMKKVLRQGIYDISFNQNFPGVILECSKIKRPKQRGTWITDDIKAAYTEMNRLGYAISAEAYQDGVLAGGCYGILLGKIFFGESMFSKKPNASKAAFLSLACRLFADGIAFIDCQVPSPHILSLGGEEISRKDFLQLLRKTLNMIS